MNVITLSKKKFQELEPLKLSKMVFNTEGCVYDFHYRGEEKVLKKLFYESGAIFANKLYTIEMLDTYKEYLPDSFCCPDYLVSVGGKISGFTLPKLNGDALTDILHDSKITPKEQIYYLKCVGSLLQQLKTIRKYTPLTSIYLNDLHESNFIVNPKNRQLYVIDLDSCKIANNEPFPARFLTSKSLLNHASHKYQTRKEDDLMGYVVADENTDLYCYNIMILNYLYGNNVDRLEIDQFYDYLNYLEYIGIDKELIDVFSRIVIHKANQNPVNYLDSLTNEQVYRAKEPVYKCVTKNK